jgi:hypothetical protein
VTARRLSVALAAGAFLVLGACGDNSNVAEWLGASDPAPLRPVAIDVLCDPSRGSTCTEATLGEMLAAPLAAAASRPGSIVRVWVQGADVEHTVLVSTLTSGKSRRSGRRAVRDYEERWITTGREEVMRGMRPHFGTHARRSPIAEAVTRVALSAAPRGAERWIVVISDGLEVSAFGEFECGRLPSPTNFVRALQREHVLAAGSLAAIHVRMCHLDLSPVDGGRCPMTLSRAAQVRAIWQSAMKAAGARDVELTDGGLSADLFTNHEGDPQ